MKVSASVLVSILSATLLALSQPPSGLGLLALFALTPWMVALRRSGPTRALVLGATLGTTYGCMIATWIPEALRGLGSTTLTSVTGLLVTAAWAKLPIFVPLALALERTKHMRWHGALLLACGAVFALEWCVSFAPLGVPWGLIGHSQIGLTGVAQLAAVGGAPAVSALVLAVNLALAMAVLRPTLALTAAWLALALLGVAICEGLRPRDASDSRTLLIVQPDIPRDERWAEDLQALNLERVAAFVQGLPRELAVAADAFVLPENLLTTPVDASHELGKAVQTWVDALGVPLITGLAMSGSGDPMGTYRGSIVWIEPGRGVVARIDKARAVPVLESSRELTGHGLVARLFGSAAGWKKVEEVPRHESGSLRASFTTTPVLCYEALFPGLVADRRTRDSVAILNLADDGWASGDDATRQLTAFAAFRAIEQRLPLIRVAHGGLSVIIDEYGRTVEALPMDRYVAHRVEVTPRPPATRLEKAALLALPLFAGLGVWWAAGLANRRSR